MAMMVRSRHQHQYGQSGGSGGAAGGGSSYGHRQMSISEMIAMLDVQSLLIDAPTTSVRQTIDVERLEDEIVSGPTAAPGSSAVTAGVASTDKLPASVSDFDTVSEQVRLQHPVTLS